MYNKYEWKTGDVITADRLNNIENGISNALNEIPDNGSNGGANDYSTNETIIGIWDNKKPLYRKVILTNTATTVNTTTNIYNASELKIDNITKFDGAINISSNIIPINYAVGSSIYVNTYYNKTQNSFMSYVSNSSYLNAPLTLIIEYTKTTD